MLEFQKVKFLIASLGISSPGECKVMPMVFQSFYVLLKVKVGISQLAVDGTENLKVLCPHLDGSFKEGHTCSVVTRLAEPLAFQSQIQTRRLHSARKPEC